MDMRKLKGEYRKCKNCNNPFYATPGQIKMGWGKYCSCKCSSLSRDNTKNLGKYAKKGTPLPKTSFKNRQWSFTGTLSEYKSLHYRIGIKLGKPNKCEMCGKIADNRKIDWANKDGNYTENPKDWIRLCKKCHFHYDNQEERMIFMSIKEVVDLSKASIEKEDLNAILTLVSPIKPQHVIELGAWKGYSAWVWIKAFKPISMTAVEIDSVDICEQYVPGSQYIYLYGSDSHDPAVFSEVKKTTPECDFLFIDGDHSLAGVTQDWEMYGPLVKKGGVVAFHDVCHYNSNPEVNIKPLWDKLRVQYKSEEIRLGKNSTGVGILYI